MRLHVAESSTILQEATPTGSGVLKLNQLRSSLDLRYGFCLILRSALRSSLYNNSGGIDGLITVVEHLTDHSAPIRANLKHTGLAYTLSRSGQTRSDRW